MFSQYHYGMLSSGHGWYGDHPVICVFVLGAPHGVVVTQAPGLMTNTPDFWAQIEIAFNPSAAINCSEPD